MADRSKIPREIKFKVRRKCGFGCVVCGYPLFEYHHWPPYAETKGHNEDDLILLCRNHHGEAGSDLLPPSAVLAAKAAPCALREGVTRPYHPRYTGSQCLVELGGGNRFHGTLAEGEAISVVEMFGEVLLQFQVEDGHLLLTLRVYDKDDVLRLWIEENELAFRTDNYDVEWVKNRIVVRTGPRRIAIEVVLSPPNVLALPRGVLWRHGCFLRITPEAVVGPFDCRYAGCTAEGAGKGIVVIDEGDDRGFSRDEPRMPLIAMALPRNVLREVGPVTEDMEEDESGGE